MIEIVKGKIKLKKNVDIHFDDPKRTEFFRRERTRRRTTNLIKNGKLKRPTACGKCEIECKPEAHHNDYDSAWDITWLCRKCHNNIHKELSA